MSPQLQTACTALQPDVQQDPLSQRQHVMMPAFQLAKLHAADQQAAVNSSISLQPDVGKPALLQHTTLCGQSNNCLIHWDSFTGMHSTQLVQHSRAQCDSFKGVSNCDAFNLTMHICSSVSGLSPCLPLQPGLIPCLLVLGHCGDVHWGVLVAGMQPVVTLCLPSYVFWVDS